MVFVHISWITNEAGHLFMNFVAMHVSSHGNCLCLFFFSVGMFVLSLLIYGISLYFVLTGQL